MSKPPRSDRTPTIRVDVRLELSESDALYDLLNGAEYKSLLWEARKKIGVAANRAKSGISGTVRMSQCELRNRMSQ